MAVRAAENHLRYGNYPQANVFAHNDDVPDLTDSTQPAYSAAFDPNDGVKRHSACDECRKRKLKCSGEPTGCGRCIRQNLVCHYSEQKQMGRPRKRQKTDEEEPNIKGLSSTPPKPLQPVPDFSYSVSVDPILSTADSDRSQFESICNGPVAQSIRTQRQQSLQETPGMYSSTSDTSFSYNGAPTPDRIDHTLANYPTDVAQWPDFSTLDSLPLPVEDKWKGLEPDAAFTFDPDADPNALSNLPAIPDCPCLPNLYLTLSTLSTLSAFPFNHHTIRTLLTAHKTAHSVIYCSVCPQKFSSGSSNLMLGCTLLNVLSDQWNRIRKLSTEDLRKAFGTPDQQTTFLGAREGFLWRMFGYSLMRAYVFGDRPIPVPPRKSSSPSVVDNESTGDMVSPTLMGLVDALTRRQRQWHRLDELTDEFPDRVTPELEKGHQVGSHDGQPGTHLCLEIINHARCIVKTCDHGPPVA